MRAIGNFYSWAHVQGKSSHHAFFVGSVACAVGATASAAVILSLVDSPVRESGIPSTSARAIVRNAGTFEAPKTVQDRPMVEAPLRPAATETVSGRDEPVTQMEAGHQARVHGEPQKHSQVVIHSRILETIYPRFFAEGTPQLLVRRTGRATQPFRQTHS
jgi:hypothetical protein